MDGAGENDAGSDGGKEGGNASFDSERCDTGWESSQLLRAAQDGSTRRDEHAARVDESAESMDVDDSVAPAEFPALRTMFTRLLAGLVCIFALALAAQHFFKQPLVDAGRAVLKKVGLDGIIVAVFVLDVFPQPISFVPFLFVALEGGTSPVRLWLAASAASILAGNVGYFIGRWVGLPEFAQEWLTRKFPAVGDGIQRHGHCGVALFALLPVPFALATWPAGALRLSFFPQFVAATSLRWLKVAIYVFGLAAAIGEVEHGSSDEHA
eukprot:TRINITY_DN42132_c0_g1_i1.p1 TRINITY_DN42132_c0_g1~~TRINITY_DN42132_c0_g1_i1.p1  ORF type:complete len:283 (+),score=68.11 TRINITY_DN42132_c0_g1_i1:50-850(+)